MRHLRRSRARRPSRSRRARFDCGDDGVPAPPRPRRPGGVERRDRGVRPPPSCDHRPRRRRAADDQRGRHVLDRLQRRDLQPSRRCASASSNAATCSAPSPTPSASSTRTRSSAPRASSTSKACSPSPSTTRASRELFIARDRLGKKPLFYAMFGGALHFASEIKALRQSPAWDRRDRSVAARGLSLARLLPGAGDDVPPRPQAAPGHWLRCQRVGVEVRQYWDVERFDDYAGRRRRAARTKSTRRSGPRSAIAWKARCRSARSCRAASTLVSSCPTWPRRSARA